MSSRNFSPSGNDSRTKAGASSGSVADIVRRATTGALSSSAQPRFMDLTAVDYMAANNRIVAGRNAFNNLPSKIRARFQNDPYQLLRFLDNPNNREEAIKLGLVQRDEPKPKRIHEMTADEWLQMEAKRDEQKAEANPQHKAS